MTDSLLPSGYFLRHAMEQDIWPIRKLVFKAKLDPTQLVWQQFWVIASTQEVIACGQLRNFTGAQELGSLVVSSEWRNRGLGTYLAKHLVKQATQPLYIECLGKKLPQFYAPLGFVPISWQDLPKSLKIKFALPILGKNVLSLPLEIMRYEGVSTFYS